MLHRSTTTLQQTAFFSKQTCLQCWQHCRHPSPSILKLAPVAAGIVKPRSSESMQTAAIEQCQRILNDVYGKCSDSAQDQWVPKPYVEGFKGRYLWTDAFGVCNYLNLFYETGHGRYLAQAKALVNDVHNNLGRTRDGSRWLGTANEDHPTAAGLRIGKPDPEGTPDGDGQYLHYLTKWMFALAQMSLATREEHYLRWAVEMAQAVLPAFMHSHPLLGSSCLYWKMGTELQGPLVHSEGNLDSYDAYVTYRLLKEAAQRMGLSKPGSDGPLADEIKQLHQMVEQRYSRYNSDDPLDLGESLWLAHWFHQEDWAKVLMQRATHSLQRLWDTGYFQQPVSRRLAFREMGSTLGLQAVNSVEPDLVAEWKPRIAALHAFWLRNLNHRDADITPMMVCSSLLPGVWIRSYRDRTAAPAGSS